MATLDVMRFVSIFVFLIDFMLKLAYLRVSKFASTEVKDFYVYVIYARIIFVVGFCFFDSGFSFAGVWSKRFEFNRIKRAKMEKEAELKGLVEKP